ncbi:MAG TPA: UDP-N-acetylmuramoyl-L-alanine--D-glutamate ligase [Patescibacteria group bacterium]|nr:UDP-N-acetylmuramoyl-L-alanine--D-glutamate ligase [Patescibacteria group bacterium]
MKQEAFQGKGILVIGAGISGVAAAGILQRLGATVTLSDSNPQEKIKQDLSGLRQDGVTLAFGHQGDELLKGIDILVLSPGVSIEIPLVSAARERGIEVVSEIEVAYRLCKAPIAAVTGTNGKTTTTTLIGEMFKTTGRPVAVGGNIGAALSQEIMDISEQGLVIAEISSFQLEGAVHFKPHIAAILNVTPDHMDRHHSLENYRAVKEKIFARQTAADYTLLNYDDPVVREIAARVPSRTVFFSRQQELEQGVFVKDGVLWIRWEGKQINVCPVADIQIKGSHNVENALAACGVAYFSGVKPQDMARVLREFPGVEHRIEPVATIDGVGYFNDSKATNPESSIKALDAFDDGQILLIAGGRDKKTDLTEFMQLAHRKVAQLILLGEAAERFAVAATEQKVAGIQQVASMAEGVELGRRLAKPGQVVLLSPACASYDMFDNYEQRGRAFKDLVRRL